MMFLVGDKGRARTGQVDSIESPIRLLFSTREGQMEFCKDAERAKNHFPTLVIDNGYKSNVLIFTT